MVQFCSPHFLPLYYSSNQFILVHDITHTKKKGLHYLGNVSTHKKEEKEIKVHEKL